MSNKTDIYSSSQLSKRLVKNYIMPHRRSLIIAFTCMIIAAAATSANALMIKPVLDDIFVAKNRELLWLIPLVIMAIAFIKAAATYVHSLIMKFIGQRIVTDMQITLYEHLLKSDIAMFGETSSGSLLSRFTNDIHIIRKDVTHVLTSLVNQLFTLIFLIGVMLYQSADLAMIGVFVFIFAIYPIVRLGKKMRKVAHKTQEELAEFAACLDDTFQGVRIVKAHHNEDYEVNKAKTIAERIFNLYIKTAKIESISSPMMEMLAGVAIAAVILYGGYQVLEGQTTAGAFFSFITALLMAYKPMKSLSSLNAVIQEGLAAIKRLFIALDTKSQILDKPNAKKLPMKNGAIKFDNVIFSYNKNTSTLRGLSLEVAAGQRVALVGNSGGGKSTIINMILRFYDPESGEILIDGHNIADVTMESLRSNIATVNQDATLFDTTIAQNIAYGRQNATDDEIVEAAKLAYADEFIMQQSDGYQTQIGQNGVKLSGGQRQRIAIARAILRNSPILLLDEATSALDTISEQKIQEAFDKLMENKTTIVIAHRLSTIVNSDLICVIDDGQMVESGTHKQLLKKGGLYTKLYNHQFK